MSYPGIRFLTQCMLHAPNRCQILKFPMHSDCVHAVGKCLILCSLNDDGRENTFVNIPPKSIIGSLNVNRLYEGTPYKSYGHLIHPQISFCLTAFHMWKFWGLVSSLPLGVHWLSCCTWIAFVKGILWDCSHWTFPEEMDGTWVEMFRWMGGAKIRKDVAWTLAGSSTPLCSCS